MCRLIIFLLCTIRSPTGLFHFQIIPLLTFSYTNRCLICFNLLLFSMDINISCKYYYVTHISYIFSFTFLSNFNIFWKMDTNLKSSCYSAVVTEEGPAAHTRTRAHTHTSRHAHEHTRTQSDEVRSKSLGLCRERGSPLLLLYEKRAKQSGRRTNCALVS